MKKWLRSIAAALCVAVLLIGLKNEDARFLLSHSNYGMQALITAKYEDVNLYIGSSMFRKGLDIKELDGGLEGTNYILSYNGTRPFQCYEELVYALQKGVSIGHLYLDMYAYSMNVDPWVEDNRLFLETDTAFKIKLWKDMYSYSDNPVKDFWEMFVTANNERLAAWPLDYELTNGLFLRGGNLQEEAGAVPALGDWTPEEHDVPAAEFNKAQLSYLIKTIELCKSRGIALTFIETPKYANVMYEEEYVGLMESYIRVLGQYDVDYYIIADTSQTCSDYLDPSDERAHIVKFDTKEPSYYADVIHLSSDGRTAFTKALVDAMNEDKDT